MSEEAVVRKISSSAKVIRRGTKIVVYSLGALTAVFFAFAWWALLVWGAVATLLWAWGSIAG